MYPILWTIAITAPIAYLAGKVGLIGKVSGFITSKISKGLERLTK